MSKASKKTIGLASMVFFLASTSVYAESTSVNISNNAEGSRSQVSVESHVESNSSSEVSSSTKTDIRIESNGEVKEYHSDKPEDISIQSDDGKVQVEVNTEDTTAADITEPEEQQKAEEMKEQEQKVLEENKGFVSQIEQFIQKQVTAVQNFFTSLLP